MDRIADILGRQDFTTPPEITAIKRFVKMRLNAEAAVSLHPATLVITVPSAAVAGSLRPLTAALQRTARSNKKIVIRIGPIVDD